MGWLMVPELWDPNNTTSDHQERYCDADFAGLIEDEYRAIIGNL
jgi:hypothetical protein